LSKIRTIILDDHVTPYRIPIFNRMAEINDDFVVIYCTERLKERRWEVYQDDIRFKYIVLRGMVIRFPKRSYPRSIIINPLLFVQFLKYSPTVVVSYAFSVPTAICWMYTRIFNKALISWTSVTPHTDRHISNLQRLARKVVIRSARACIAASPQGKDLFRDYGVQDDDIFMVTQIADHWFTGTVIERQIDTEIVLFVGFLDKRKGVDHLLRAFNLVCSAHGKAKLVLVGTGRNEDALRDYVEEQGLSGRVTFAGYVQQKDLVQYYASANIFVLPTLEDSFGVVLAEAAATGLPIISTPYAGAADLYVKHGENGYIVEPTDHEALASAILNLLGNPDREKMGAISRKIAERYTPETSAEVFNEAIERAFQRHLATK